MKRPALPIFLALLLLTACGAQQPLETTPALSGQATVATRPVTAATSDPLPAASPPAPTAAPTEPAAPTTTPETAQPSPGADVALPEQENDSPDNVGEVGQAPPARPVYGQTAEGAYFYGDPEAPLTLIDYSDFL